LDHLFITVVVELVLQLLLALIIILVILTIVIFISLGVLLSFTIITTVVAFLLVVEGKEFLFFLKFLVHHRVIIIIILIVVAAASTENRVGDSLDLLDTRASPGRSFSFHHLAIVLLLELLGRAASLGAFSITWGVSAGVVLTGGGGVGSGRFPVASFTSTRLGEAGCHGVWGQGLGPPS
jgi:hypothetical protein